MASPRWGLAEAVGGVVVGLLLSSILAALSVAVWGGPDLNLAGRALSALGLWVGLVGAAVVASRRRGTGRLSDDFGFRLSGVDLPLGAAAGILSQLVLLPVVALALSPLIGRPDVDGPARRLIESAGGPALAVLVVLVVVGAPVVEELFYRGLVLGSLARRFGGAWAVGVSAALFGVSHQNDLPVEGVLLVMASLAALGVVLAVLVRRTGRLGPAIVAHVTFNAFTVASVLTR